MKMVVSRPNPNPDRRETMRRSVWQDEEGKQVQYNNDEYNYMSIWGLRELIEKRGGDERALDGTREMLAES